MIHLPLKHMVQILMTDQSICIYTVYTRIYICTVYMLSLMFNAMEFHFCEGRKKNALSNGTFSKRDDTVTSCCASCTMIDWCPTVEKLSLWMIFLQPSPPKHNICIIIRKKYLSPLRCYRILRMVILNTQYKSVHWLPQLKSTTLVTMATESK